MNKYLWILFLSFISLPIFANPFNACRTEIRNSARQVECAQLVNRYGLSAYDIRSCGQHMLSDQDKLTCLRFLGRGYLGGAEVYACESITIGRRNILSCLDAASTGYGLRSREIRACGNRLTSSNRLTCVSIAAQRGLYFEQINFCLNGGGGQQGRLNCLRGI